MGVVSWVVVGLIAGAVARRVTGTEPRGCLFTLAIGVLGGLVGGALWNAATGETAMSDFGLGSLALAFLGATGLLVVVQALERRR